jgi:hypothetical protein
MESAVLMTLLAVWLLLLGSAAIVTLLPAARPGHEGDVIPLTLRRKHGADDRPAA